MRTKNNKTKLVGVTIRRDVVEKIKEIIPKLGVDTLSEAYKKIILLWLTEQGIDVPKEAFEKRQPRDPLSPEARKIVLKNLKLADKANPKKNQALKSSKKRPKSTPPKPTKRSRS